MIALPARQGGGNRSQNSRVRSLRSRPAGRSLHRGVVVAGDALFDLDVLVGVADALVVSLDRPRALLAGVGLLVVQDVLPAAGHLGLARHGVDDHLALVPAGHRRTGAANLGEAGARSVLAGTVIPVPAVGRLELDPAQCVQPLLAFGRPGVEDEHGRRVTTGAAGVELEEDAVVRVVVLGRAPATADAAGREGAVLHHAVASREHGPAVGGHAVEDRVQARAAARAALRAAGRAPGAGATPGRAGRAAGRAGRAAGRAGHAAGAGRLGAAAGVAAVAAGLVSAAGATRAARHRGAAAAQQQKTNSQLGKGPHEPKLEAPLSDCSVSVRAPGAIVFRPMIDARYTSRVSIVAPALMVF